MQVSDSVLARGARLFETELEALCSLGGIDGAVYAYQKGRAEFILKFVPTSPDRIALARAKWDFADYLARNGVSVAKPVLSRNGQLLEVIQEGQTVYVVSASEKAPGQHADWRRGQAYNDRVFEVWGKAMGRMHALTKLYDRGAEFGGWQEEHAFFAEWCQEDDVRAKWLALGKVLETFPQTPDDYGLIHNDLHPHNFLVHDVDGEPNITIIDFDVCNRHWFATDIATALYPLAIRWVRPPDGSVSHQAFVQRAFDRFMAGYSQENAIDSSWLEQLPHFFKYRQMLLFVVFTDEWRQGTEWQAKSLREWRRHILEDVPVMAFGV